VPGQLEGECREAKPGDPDRPRARHVGQVVHAEQDPADPDQGDERHDHGGKRHAPPAAGGGQEDQEHRAVADDRAKPVPAGEAVPDAVGDRMRHHRAKPPDQRFEDRVKHERTRAGDNQVDRQPPPPPDRENGHRGRDDRPQHAIAAQPGNRLDRRHECGLARDQAVDASRGKMVGRLQRWPLQAHQNQQDREDRRRGDNRGERRETAA
jgi:hypothetical protein